MIEAISDFDDDVANKYLKVKKFEMGEAGIQQLFRLNCWCNSGSAFKNKGVQMLMDAVVDYLPSHDLPPMKGEG